ncbi:MAG: hypothetical protein HY646_04225 [Acidobacteria bacterium]|nr:hypothetical protein [Acidobacteriota bacterium]
MNKHQFTLHRFIASATFVLLLVSTEVWAAGPVNLDLRKEAFIRGGKAIEAALMAKTEAEPLAVSRAVPAGKPAPPPPQMSGGGMNKMVWAGLIAGFAVSGILVYHFAPGPGASVRNCSTCK